MGLHHTVRPPFKERQKIRKKRTNLVSAIGISVSAIFFPCLIYRCFNCVVESNKSVGLKLSQAEKIRRDLYFPHYTTAD